MIGLPPQTRVKGVGRHNNNAKLTGSGFYGFDVDSTAVEIFRDETKLVKHVW